MDAILHSLTKEAFRQRLLLPMGRPETGPHRQAIKRHELFSPCR